MHSGVDHIVLPANHTTPAFTRSSPVIAPADEAYYSFIDPMRMKGWVVLVGHYSGQFTHTNGYPSAAGPGADQWKFADQRPTFYHWAPNQQLQDFVILYSCQRAVEFALNLYNILKDNLNFGITQTAYWILKRSSEL